jgi:hypothetical protein
MNKIMWRTNIGDRVLEGLERSFYIELMAYAIDRLEEYDNAGDLDFAPITGDRIFDSANFGQKILLLRDSLAALIDPSIPTPKHQNRGVIRIRVKQCHETLKVFSYSTFSHQTFFGKGD